MIRKSLQRRWNSPNFDISVHREAPTYLPRTLSRIHCLRIGRKAVSEFDAFASHFAGESGFVKRTAASRYNYQAVLQRFEQSLDPSFLLRTVRRTPFDPQLPERSSEMRTGFFS